MSNPIKSVPLRTAMFDGEGMKALGNLNRLWTDFFSSGEGWISQGTHAARLATSSGGVPDGGFFIETDRGAVYQSRFVGRAQAWVLVLGMMSGLLAARPRDLGGNDTGFLYSATDALDYRWNGTAWATLDTARGGSGLTHVNRVTKVTAAGVIGESSIVDDGTTITLIEAVAMLVAGATIDIRTPDNTTSPVLGLWQDQGGDRNYGAFLYVKPTSSDAAVVVRKNGVDTEILTILNTDGKVGVKNTAPAYAFDVTGDQNVTGVYRVDGTQVVSNRGAALTASAVAATGAGGGYNQVVAQSCVDLANNLRTRVLELEARLQAHGLIT